MKKRYILAIALAAAMRLQTQAQSISQSGFGPQQVIATQVEGAVDIIATDLDGDGDQDIVSAARNADEVAWYENDGEGNFGPPRVITTQANFVLSLYAADLDGDGDQDVLSASAGDNKIAWYKNDGQGNFSQQLTISTQVFSARGVYAADLDGDGDQDVLSVAVLEGITWYKNDGQGNFTKQRTFAGTDEYVFTADLDGDGDQDILTFLYYDSDAVWYENDGQGNFALPQKTTNQRSVRDALAIDFDQDGDLDVLTNNLTWYPNDGQGNFGQQQIIALRSEGVQDVFAADLDLDGDLDVLSASITSNEDRKISWYENDGQNNFGPRQVITNRAYGDVVAYTDLDGDGDVDALATSISASEINWYENLLDVAAPRITGFALINARNDERVQFLQAGDVVDISALRSANIQALTSGDIAWVRFNLSGTINRRSSDNTLPYAIAGNVGTDFYGPAPRNGSYTLTATPFYEEDGQIVRSKPETISFTFVGGNSNASTVSLRVYPNTFNEALFVDTEQATEQVQVRLQSIQGQPQAVDIQQEAGQLRINTQRVPAGHYILQVSSAEGTQTRHVVKE